MFLIFMSKRNICNHGLNGIFIIFLILVINIYLFYMRTVMLKGKKCWLNKLRHLKYYQKTKLKKY